MLLLVQFQVKTLLLFLLSVVVLVVRIEEDFSSVQRIYLDTKWNWCGYCRNGLEHYMCRLNGVFFFWPNLILRMQNWSGWKQRVVPSSSTRVRSFSLDQLRQSTIQSAPVDDEIGAVEIGDNKIVEVAEEQAQSSEKVDTTASKVIPHTWIWEFIIAVHASFVECLYPDCSLREIISWFYSFSRVVWHYGNFRNWFSWEVARGRIL